MEEKKECTTNSAWLWLSEDIVRELEVTPDDGEDFKAAAAMLASLTVGVDADRLCEATGYPERIVHLLVKSLRAAGRCEGDRLVAEWNGDEFDEWGFWIDFVTSHETVEPETVTDLEKLAEVWVEDYVTEKHQFQRPLWVEECRTKAPAALTPKISPELWEEVLARVTGKGDKHARNRPFLEAFIRDNHGCSFEDAKAAAEQRGRHVSKALWNAAKGRAAAGTCYRNPDDPSLTWSGRGRRPLWLNELIEKGVELETLRAAG